MDEGWVCKGEVNSWRVSVGGDVCMALGSACTGCRGTCIRCWGV